MENRLWWIGSNQPILFTNQYYNVYEIVLSNIINLQICDDYVRGPNCDLGSSVAVELINHNSFGYIYLMMLNLQYTTDNLFTIGVVEFKQINHSTYYIPDNTINAAGQPSNNFGNLKDINWFGFNNTGIEFSEDAKLRFYKRTSDFSSYQPSIYFDVFLDINKNISEPPLTQQTELLVKYYAYNWGDKKYGQYETGGTFNTNSYEKLSHPNGGELWTVKYDSENKNTMQDRLIHCLSDYSW